MLWRKLNLWYVLATPIAAPLAVVADFKIEGKSYSGFLWLALLLAALYLLALGGLSALERRAWALWCPWILWAAFMWASLLWCSAVDANSIQNAMQMSMPVVVGIVATAAIRTRDDLRRLLRAFRVTLGLLSVFAAFYALGVYGDTSRGLGTRDASLTAVLVGGILFADFPRQKIVPLLGWGACLLFTAATGSRMASVALLILPVLHLGYRSILWNVTGMAAIATLTAVLFQTPMVQERLFYSGRGEVADLLTDDVNGSGRFEAWPDVWDEAWKRPWLGAGIGSANKFVPLVWEDISHVHNDYLRIGFEFGLIGLAVFLTVALWQLLRLYCGVQSSAGVLKTAAAAAWLGFWGMLITCCTDNTLVYNLYYMNPLFALIGGFYGVSLAERSRPPSVADEQTIEDPT